MALEVALRTPVGDGWARVIAPESLRLHFAAPARPPVARYGRLDGARVSLRVERARASLTRGDLQQLAPGDVILFDPPAAGDARSGPALLGLGRGGFRGRIEGDRFTIDQPFKLQPGAPMDEKPETGANAQLLGELPVEVACEIGRVTLSGRELLELRPGAVIPVGRPLSGPVDLTVGGRVVARGELVDVEGELGVRINQLCD